MKLITDTLPSGRTFSLQLELNHPTLLPGVQVMTESALLKGGKLLRPKLCFLVAEALQVPFEKVSAYSRIAELVHGATLAHDDVIDEATERRNKSTLNRNGTQARAVLVGDLMLSRAMVELCELGNPVLLRRMSEVLEDLVTGEWLQLENRKNLEVPMRTLEVIASYKTASMMQWCVEVPFVLNQAEPDLVRLAKQFGNELGLAFQFIDDCVDFYETSGKAFSGDLTEGLLNQVTWHLIHKKPELRVFFQAVMKAGDSIDADEFRATVGHRSLQDAIEIVKTKAQDKIHFAERILLHLEKNAAVKVDFRYVRELAQGILERKR